VRPLARHGLRQARFELEQQRPDTERSLLAHHAEVALTNLLTEISAESAR
jgi:hypothetical protein